MQPPDKPRFTVFLAKAGDYDNAAAKKVADLLDYIDIPLSGGDAVLVKPNLLRAENTGVTCTNALIIAAVCRYLRDHGCRVTIGDSPGFGTAKGVAGSIGLDAALAKAGCADIPIVTLDSPRNRPLTLGGHVGLSRMALEADHIVSIPKLKAHSQMRVTGAVKNLFGCVSGVRKAFLHARHGDTLKDGVSVFPSAIVDIMGHLPRVTTVLDGIRAMHVTGPSGGEPFAANLLAVSESPTATDTAIYAMLGVSPGEIPVWHELRRRNEPGAFFEEIVLTGEAIEHFDFSGFVLPEKLNPETFNPARLLISTAKRLWARVAPIRS